MLLQAVGNVASLNPTGFSEIFRLEGHVSSSKGSKNHQRGGGTHCSILSSAHFAFACQYHNRVTFFCKTRAHGHALLHRMEVHRIPAGLHQARKRSIRHTVSFAAAKTSSVEDTFQQGEASKEASSNVYKAAVLSPTNGLEGKAEIPDGKPAHVLTTDTASSEEVRSRNSEPTKQNAGGMKGLMNWWKVLHEVYKKDTAMWGYGTSPIFTVYEGPDGKIEKVCINEKEIQRRQGVEPYLPGFGGDESKARAKQKILLAENIAKDLEMGKLNIDTNSTIVTVIKHPSKAQNETGQKKLFTQIDVAMHKAAPILRSVFMIAIPVYGLCMLIGAYLLVTKRSEEDIIIEEQSAANLEKMRKLKAQMSTWKNTADVAQVTIAPSDFMQKCLEVREMARQVRSEEALQQSVKEQSAGNLKKMRKLKAQMSAQKNTADVGEVTLDPSDFNQDLLDFIEMARPVLSEEGLQNSVKDSTTVVEDYQPQEESSLSTSVLIAGNAVSTEHGGIGHEDVIDTVVNDSSVPTMHNMGGVNGTDSVIDVTCKPLPKVKPRLITSLDEAMAILGDKQTVSPNGVKSSADCNGTAEGAFNGRGSRAEHESASNNSVSATINGSSNSVTEAMPFKVDEILNTSLERQAKIGERESIWSFKAESLQRDGSLRPDKADIETLDSRAPAGQAVEAETFDTKFERGSDDMQDFEETTASRLSSENLKNGSVNETQVFSSVRSSKVINTAQKLKDAPFRPSKTFLKNYSASKSVLNVDTDEVVGSGQPLRRREASMSNRGPMSNTKRWSKELQRKYDLEKNPETRELMKEIGSELDSWVTEEEVEEVSELASRLVEGDDEDVVRKQYENLQKKVKKEKEKFGLEAVLEKYKEYQPKREDELWWLDLPCVLCLMVVSAKEEGRGLYGLDMSIDFEGMSNQQGRHIIAFEDRRDVSNFCRLLELRSDSRFRFAQVCPFSPKKLYETSKEEGFKVTVLKAGQIQTHIDQTLEEVEEQIVEIGRRTYWDKMERDNSIDMDCILHQRFGL